MDNGASSYRRFRDNNDESGLEEIIREYRDGLIFYLNRIVGNIHTAEELAEDVFVLLGTKKPRDKGKGSFKTWLYTIGRNIALNYLKQNARVTKIPVDQCPELTAGETDFAMVDVRADQKLAVRRALCQLKPEYQQVLWLIYFEDFSNKEAAAVMKKSVHSVETLVYRARRSLKSQLETEGYPNETL